ncbi:MAG: 3-deoxy-manno-octulosonate cytidylyltransferase [Marinilabiliaceae bacterium]|nr:3-deoxy-manno-octulosonate cytidylyltransferase [Marinilabiliaceae bacterium]
MNNSVIGLIPARYASTRFPGKPLADIGGKPMIQRVYEQASQVLSSCYVATDDERIADAVRRFNGKVVMTASTHKSGTDRCAEALNNVELMENKKFYAVINIQGDEPFINPEQISLLASAFDNPTTEIATLVKPIDNNDDLLSPNKPKVVISEEGNALYFSRQPIPFLRGVELNEWLQKGNFYNHIGMYGYRSDILRKITLLPLGTLEKAESLEQLRWLENGYRIKVLQTYIESLSVDTPDDLEALKSRGLI